jgi:hypothetical protein
MSLEKSYETKKEKPKKQNKTTNRVAYNSLAISYGNVIFAKHTTHHHLHCQSQIPISHFPELHLMGHTDFFGHFS